jgi:alpha-tubulin suppressor-like RCC1 family protein
MSNSANNIQSGTSTNNISFSQAVRVSIAKFGLGQKVNNVKWGDAELLENRDLSKLTRAHLKRHLSARDLGVKGNRSTLLQRLRDSLENEREIKRQKAAEAEAKHRQIADLEEMGAVYCVGSNHRGQLGLGDLENRNNFTVIPNSRGLGIREVAARNDIVFAVTKTKDVYCWGGGGVGPMGFDGRRQRAKFESIQNVESLEEEDIVEVSIGSNHACAVSECGDLYVWGEGRNGCLGTGQLQSQTIPDLVPTFTEMINIEKSRSGEMHNCVLTNSGEVYSFGHLANGRLGLGYFNNKNKIDFSIPHIIHFPLNETIGLISCGAEHTVAVGNSRIFSWGSGDGGRLGHNDFNDRWEPTEISSLSGQMIVDISCGTWHSACIVAVPPMQKDRGWLYTWGSGLNGQLGQIDITTSMKPSIVPFFCEKHKLLKKVICGSHHNAVITSEDELYTWGSNLNCCLGHEIEEHFVSFTPTPSYCSGFGTIVDRIGRGLPESVALGRGYTIVCTKKYIGPTEKIAKELMEEHEKKEKETRQSNEIKALNKFKQLLNTNKKKDKTEEIQFLTSVRLCTLCEPGNGCTGKLIISIHSFSVAFIMAQSIVSFIEFGLPGFQVHATKPSICRECGHSSIYHTITQ